MRPQPIAPDQIRDVLEIEQLLYRYPIALDTRDYDALDEIFVAGAQLVMGGRTMTPAQYKEMCRVELGKLDGTHHLVSAVAVQLDGLTATAHAYHQAQHIKKSLAPDGLFLMAGWVDDELVRANGRWHITKRVWTAVWSSGNSAVLGR